MVISDESEKERQYIVRYSRDMAGKYTSESWQMLQCATPEELGELVQKKIPADMICVENLKERSRQLEELGVDVIAVHTGVDQQAAGRTPLQDLKELRSAVTCAQIAVAGGIRLDTMDAYLEYEPEIIIVGGGIVHAEDPAGETKKLAEKIRERKR